jgi:hypothetical protein
MRIPLLHLGQSPAVNRSTDVFRGEGVEPAALPRMRDVASRMRDVVSKMGDVVYHTESLGGCSCTPAPGGTGYWKCCPGQPCRTVSHC